MPLLWEGNGTPLWYSCLENPMDGGAWWAAIHGVAKSQTQLSDFPFTFHFHALEKEMATHSSVLAWRIPGMGELGGRPSMGSRRVGHDWSDLAAVIVILLLTQPMFFISTAFSRFLRYPSMIISSSYIDATPSFILSRKFLNFSPCCRFILLSLLWHHFLNLESSHIAKHYSLFVQAYRGRYMLIINWKLVWVPRGI